MHRPKTGENDKAVTSASDEYLAKAALQTGQASPHSVLQPREWQWVFVWCVLLASLTLAPYIWVFMVDSVEPGWHFMGMLPNPQDCASYLAKM